MDPVSRDSIKVCARPFHGVSGRLGRLCKAQQSRCRRVLELRPRFSVDCLITALERFRDSEDAQSVKFTVKFLPYQLMPEASKEGQDKYEWYRKYKYGDSEEKMKMYCAFMESYGAPIGINFKFGGQTANTLDAHRVVQHFQEEKGPETADKLINCRFVCVADCKDLR